MDKPPALGTHQKKPGTQPAATLSNVRSTPFFELFDGLLRRRESYFETIFQGKEVGALIRWSLLATVLLSGLYGLTMGAASFTSAGWGTGFAQSLSSAVKVPLLYLLSLLVSYPVLYFVIVIMGSRLSFSQTLALILLAVTMNAILLAGCAPIVLFFVFTGSGYIFIKLLHVVIFAFSGAWAMMALWQGLTSMCEKSDLYPKRAVRILQVWILVFGFVGTQMAWSLRPFVGDPGQKFEIVRADQSGNIYFSVWQSIVRVGTGADDKKVEKPEPGSERSVNPDEEIMTIEEVAKYLKMKPQTIYKWAQDGQIPGTKLGKEWRFRKHILDEWIDASIVLSKGGFDHLIRSSMVENRRAGLSEDEMDSLLKEAME